MPRILPERRLACPASPWLALLLLPLLGCARFQPKPLDLAETSAHFHARTLESPELRAFLETNLGPTPVWPPPQWSFEQLVYAALFLNPKLDLARAELASTRAAEITAGGRPNPTAGVMPEYTFNPADVVSPWLATVQFDIPIETAGKRRHRIGRAQQLAVAARLRLVSTAWEVRSAVRGALLDLHNADQRTNLLARQIEAQQRAVSALETKLALGAATSAEALPPRLGLARMHKELADTRVQAGEARARLAAAIGVPLAALPPSPALSSDLEPNASLTTADARRRALTSRADLLAALAEYAAAETALKLEVAKQYPDVHLGTGYEFDQGESRWALGLTVELPLLNRNQGPMAEAGAKRAEAAARVQALQARIIGETERALAAWQGAQSRFAALAEVRAMQEKHLSSVRAQFDAGAVEKLDVLAAETELAAGQLLHWEARVNALRASGELEDSVQFPLPVDLSLNPRRSEP